MFSNLDSSDPSFDISLLTYRHHSFSLYFHQYHLNICLINNYAHFLLKQVLINSHLASLIDHYYMSINYQNCFLICSN